MIFLSLTSESGLGFGNFRDFFATPHLTQALMRSLLLALFFIMFMIGRLDFSGVTKNLTDINSNVHSTWKPESENLSKQVCKA